MSDKKSFKHGRLTKDEINYIKANPENLTLEELVSRLQRKPSLIRKYMSPEMDTSARETTLQRLKSKSFFSDLYSAFTHEEVIVFSTMWVDFIEQFGHDVLASEELELKELITYEILKNRVLIEQKKLMDRRDTYEEELSYELKISVIDRDDDAIKRISGLESRISSLSEDIDKKKKEFRELADKEYKSRDKLYKRRVDRTEDLNKAKLDFTELTKKLQEPEFRRKHAVEMEIMALAAKKEEIRMGELFEFADNKPDQLLINVETAKQGDKDD